MTVEAALGICSIVAVFALALTGMSMVIGQLRCTDAAVEAARLVARGERDRAREMVRRIAPGGARLHVTVRGDEITTRVTVRPAGGLLPDGWLAGRAVAVMEPGQGQPDQAVPQAPPDDPRDPAVPR
ncbi:hypothetical protein DFQ14_11277 [Halopolyspora algeriensis]|uniref:TadE-like protein n=1 Tax=Halopolyspora algeriensis TaxID=1500506 RepID=A0A368VG98_9ACTN|nr:TadE family type IV pilus minor pilin [Halopolyspora algeriensis]RCW40197.1 hypothetical protein DFQ14_11277 [Halopolyspora algeriensis]TQM46321.1 hypothetical protein FHU43_3993 [Halopolyspora algeriensis]